MIEEETPRIFKRRKKRDSKEGEAGLSLFFFEQNKMLHNKQAIPPWELLNKALPGSSIEEFFFGLPCVVKGADPTTGSRFVRGVASTPDRDLQDEYVIQKGMDLKYFLKHGYLNNDHKPGFENKVGQPTTATIKRIKDRSGKSVVGLWLEGYLWPEGTHKVADSIWELAKALEAADSDRRLGFSIQGKVLQREGRRIVRAWVQDVAITPSPVNTSTWLEVVDSLTKSAWVTTEDIADIKKSISPSSFRDEPLIGEPSGLWTQGKSLTTSSSSSLAPESLEGRLKILKTEDTDDEVGKAISSAYGELRRRGHGEEESRRGAFAAVAKTLLECR